MNDKTIIVSGGATLIGVECARALANRGAHVVIADINEADGAAAAEELGRQVVFHATDITDDASIDDCVAATLKSRGGIDGLVNVACTYHDEGMDSSREDWHTALDVNLVGAAVFASKLAPHMEKRGGGAIVNFGSISAKVAQPGRMLYSVSKAAILGMTRNQALALADANIRVNSVSPGWTWSNVIREFSGNNRSKADQVAEPFHLISRVVGAEEVGAAVAFLCSDEASGITGTDVAVDGGYTAIAGEQKTDKVSLLTQ